MVVHVVRGPDGLMVAVYETLADMDLVPVDLDIQVDVRLGPSIIALSGTDATEEVHDMPI